MTIAQKRRRGRPRNSDLGLSAAEGTVLGLDRALTLLARVAAHDGIGLTALAQEAAMPASSVHRMLATLAAHGFVEMEETGQRWFVGVGAFRIGAAFARRASAVAQGRPIMRRLMAESGETVNLGLFDDGRVVFVAQVEGRDPVRAFFRAGERRFAHASGIGKVLLAYLGPPAVERLIAAGDLAQLTARTITDPPALRAELDLIRARGWSFDDEEGNAGMRCVAAPIFNDQGEVVAGVSVSGPSQRLTPDRIADLGPRVRAAADAITQAIGGTSRF